MNKSQYWINKLELLPHPEGGYYKETYRSIINADKKCLPHIFKGRRSFSTAIYFMLEKEDISVFHKIKSDEIWHFHDGAPMVIYVIEDDGKITELNLGISDLENIFPQAVVPANRWFAAKSKGEYTLVSCTVSPGFDFNDFEMADKKYLLKKYPEHSALIDTFTY
ncbi:MAG: cupin domain-containing protein [Lentimicrobiaceae bacterium]|jgi:hypothetical protein|nr:cupin domain-containing protein [Lentimicrobiaceae bacterium]MCP4909275.1 cupin domain-containing protein [Bacteroidota bacterium]MBT3455022.1 cupin domain-containing protein [Lentimicrobiaceae bacterium]MBT3818665.1 cupin domain-containing protein [Lentimicrobiaceae bacterium]MBT4060396.1 cupin domain-containing protein [Lentimicrobiaceae bacterium]